MNELTTVGTIVIFSIIGAIIFLFSYGMISCNIELKKHRDNRVQAEKFIEELDLSQLIELPLIKNVQLRLNNNQTYDVPLEDFRKSKDVIKSNQHIIHKSAIASEFYYSALNTIVEGIGEVKLQGDEQENLLRIIAENVKVKGIRFCYIKWEIKNDKIENIETIESIFN